MGNALKGRALAKETDLIKREKNVTIERPKGASRAILVKQAGQASRRELLVLDGEADGVVNLGTSRDRDYWYFRGAIYSTPVTLTADQLEMLVAARAKPPTPKVRPARRRIPRAVRDAVWERDGGKCVICGGLLGLQFDHKLPFSAGGTDDAENLQILCGKRNREKGARL